MNLADKLTLESSGFEPFEFKMKWLSNQLQTQIYNVDFKYSDEYKKLSKSNEFLIAQKKFLKDVENAQKIKEKEIREQTIQQITLDYTALQNDEAMAEPARESTMITNELEYRKNIELFKLITLPDKPYPDSEEFWQNANLGLIKDVIEFFRKSYKL